MPEQPTQHPPPMTRGKRSEDPERKESAIMGMLFAMWLLSTICALLAGGIIGVILYHFIG